jgi:hypothetical protein
MTAVCEAISGGIANCTKARRANLFKLLKELMSDKGKGKGRKAPGRWTKRKQQEAFRKQIGEELCCLPSAEELREEKRIAKRKGRRPTKKQRRAARRALA